MVPLRFRGDSTELVRMRKFRKTTGRGAPIRVNPKRGRFSNPLCHANSMQMIWGRSPFGLWLATLKVSLSWGSTSCFRLVSYDDLPRMISNFEENARLLVEDLPSNCSKWVKRNRDTLRCYTELASDSLFCPCHVVVSNTGKTCWHAFSVLSFSATAFLCSLHRGSKA